MTRSLYGYIYVNQATSLQARLRYLHKTYITCDSERAHTSTVRTIVFFAALCMFFLSVIRYEPDYCGEISSCPDVSVRSVLAESLYSSVLNDFGILCKLWNFFYDVHDGLP